MKFIVKKFRFEFWPSDIWRALFLLLIFVYITLVYMEMIKNYPKKTFDHAVVAVDAVIFTVKENKLHALLLELKESPYQGKWAIPGGLVTNSETLEESAHRHLFDKTNIENAYIEQLYTFGDPNRDPNGWVVSVAYMALVTENLSDIKTSDRYKSLAWKAIDDLPDLAYDHKQIVEMAYKRLQNKLSYTNIVYTLLPDEFTLSELQTVYEIILDKELDKRNFRKKLNALNILEELPKKRSEGAHRPAQLFKFKDESPVEIDIL